jgi:hypothetical protein
MQSPPNLAGADELQLRIFAAKERVSNRWFMLYSLLLAS